MHSNDRDWKDYNKKLIARGEFYINPQFLATWREEVRSLNECKVGQPYFYPTSLFEFAAALYAKSFDLRTLEGVLRGLSQHLGRWPVPSYTQLYRRIRQLSLHFAPRGGELIAGVDGTGFKVTDRGEWIRHKWAVKRGWVKVTLLGDADGNVIDVLVGDDETDERAEARTLIEEHADDLALLSADGLHDTNETFNLLEKHNIVPVVKIRKNANPKGFGARPRAVREYQSMEHAEWVKKYGYGLRWPATEGIFGAVKRGFGETLRSHTKKGLEREARLKFWTYQRVRDHIQT